jgi:hypothetical protein
MIKTKKVICSLLMVFAVTANGCSSTGSYGSFRTEEKILVGDSAQKAFEYEGIERVPVIVIPGIFGSRLVDSTTNKTVWGAFTGKESLTNLSKEQVRLLSLPMEEGKSLAELKDTVVPAGALETINVRLLGLPIHVNGYKDMIDALEKAGYYSDVSNSGDGRLYNTCFTFGYDFRRDLVETAAQLEAFIQEKKKYLQQEYEEHYGIKDYDVKFDIVAHSMGGLITRYYMMYGDSALPEDGSRPELTWKGAQNIRKAIIVGTPNAGYLDAFTELIEGMTFAPGAPKIEPAVLGTFTTLYEMMPFRAPAMVVNAADENEAIDLYDPDLWIKMQWGLADPAQDKVLAELLPNVPSAEARCAIAIDQLKKSLERANRFTDAIQIDATPPQGVSLHLFLGESMLTNAKASVDLKTGDVQVIQQLPGDGKVSAPSALANERSGDDPWPFLQTPIHWSSVIFLFSAHMGITNDPVFTINLMYTLLTGDSAKSNSNSAT